MKPDGILEANQKRRDVGSEVEQNNSQGTKKPGL